MVQGQTVLTELSAGLKLETSLGHFYFGMEDPAPLWLLSEEGTLAREQVPCATPQWPPSALMHHQLPPETCRWQQWELLNHQ